MYWSPVTRLKNTPDPTVAPTTLDVRRATRRKTFDMAESIPLPYIMPPKHMAQIISHTVFIIPPMPPVATRSLSSGLPVSTAVSVVDASTTAYFDINEQPSFIVAGLGLAIGIAYLVVYFITRKNIADNDGKCAK